MKVDNPHVSGPGEELDDGRDHVLHVVIGQMRPHRKTQHLLGRVAGEELLLVLWMLAVGREGGSAIG